MWDGASSSGDTWSWQARAGESYTMGG
jgi:hypothetical protein